MFSSYHERAETSSIASSRRTETVQVKKGALLIASLLEKTKIVARPWVLIGKQVSLRVE